VHTSSSFHPSFAGRLSSGDLPRLAAAPSAASSVGDSSQHGSVRQDSAASRLGVDIGLQVG